MAIAFAAALLLRVEPVAAQDCGNWPYPVLCTAELVVTDSNNDRGVLGRESEVRLAPRDRFDLELEARDQRGRYFPGDRLALYYDDRECRSMLRVEDRGEGQLRIDAVAAQGRCTLEIYAPNNMNFRWFVQVEISAAARVGYDRAEAELVANALYAAILGREPDPAGFDGARGQIEAGNLEVQVQGMLGSSEFREVRAGQSPSQLLEQFYRGILGREGDSAGVRLYLGEMRRGQYASVLLKLIRSPEFELRLQR